MLRTAVLSLLVASSAAFVLPGAGQQQLDNCSPPNGTDVQMHWWQCNSGPVQFLNATPYDSTGKNYEYPIHLSQPIVVKTQIVNPTNTYQKPALRNTVNIWKYGGWSGCAWSSVPTLGLLKDLSACDHGVPCPVYPGAQELDVTIDFTQFEQIISLLKDNQPYQLEYLLHDNTSGDDACMMVQAWAYIKQMLRCLLVCSVLVALSAVNACDTWPNSTETKVTWWQCSSGPIMVSNVNPTDKSGAYEYPIRLTEPLLIATTINNPSSTYKDPSLKQTIKVAQWNANTCGWTNVPTFGLLNNIPACSNGVPCPIVPGNNQVINLELDFSDTPAIINLLKNDKPYQLEYHLHDDDSNQDLCITFQARALTK